MMTLLVCPLCFAAVADRELHVAWHQNRDENDIYLKTVGDWLTIHSTLHNGHDLAQRSFNECQTCYIYSRLAGG